MASLADLQRAGAIQQQVRTRNLQGAAELLESVSPYLTLTELESKEYGSISEDNFTKLYKEEPDKVLKILNSSPTATTYTDINTGERAKGKIVNIREQDGKITFDIQGKQGIVPKTLGFSNDPKDIVMATDREGLRTMVNAIVQGSGNRLTAAKKGFGSRTQGILTNEVARQNLANDQLRKLEDAENAPDAIGILEDQVDAGMDPREAFAMITQIATDFNNGLDDLRRKQGEELTQVDKDLEQYRSDREKADNMSDFSRFGSAIGTGSGIPLGDRDVQPTPKSEEELAAEKQKQNLLTRIGNTNIAMPRNASPDVVFNFIEQNSNLLQEFGIEQANVDKARAALFKYNVQKPEDLKTIPEYDDELDINKVELASALAVAAGGDFNTEFQQSLNLLETGNINTTRMQEQTFNQNTMKFNEDLKVRSEANKIEARKAAAEAGNKAIEDAYNAFDKDLIALNKYINKGVGDEGGIGDITANEAQFHFKRMVDKFTNAQLDGTVSNAMVDGMRLGVGQALYSVMMNRGDDDQPWYQKIFGGRPNQQQTLGDIVNTARGIYEEKVGGGLQLKKIIFVDSSGQQVGKAIEGKVFTDTFNDLATNVEVSQFIKPYRGD